MIKVWTLWLILLFFIDWQYCQVIQKVNLLLLPEEFEENQKGQILCIALTESTSLNFVWFKDDSPFSVDDSTDVRQVDESTTSRLMFDSLKASHKGKYTCVVKNGKESNEATQFIIVKVSPKWVLEPQNAIVEEDGKLILNCSADGNPKPIIHWKKKGDGTNEYLSIENMNYVQMTSNNSLIINPALKLHSGIYLCQASSGYGNNLTKLIKVTVYVPPKLQNHYISKVVESGSSISFPCQSSGDQPLFLTWTKNNKTINSQHAEYPRYETSKENKQMSVISILSIKNIQKRDEGIFSCLAENDFGQDWLNVKIIVLERPYHPINISVEKVWSQSAKIAWMDSSHSTNRALQYIVEYWSISDPESKHENITVSGLSTWCIINELQSASVYRVQIWAKNNVGISQPSEQLVFTTGHEEPSASPKDFHLKEVGATYAQLSWRPPPSRQWNGELIGFFVGYKASITSDVFSYHSVLLKGDIHSFILRGLKPHTRYSVIVKAYNDIGSGPPTEELIFRTKQEDPAPQPILYIENWNSLSIHLRWTVPVTETILSGFTLSYKKEGYDWKEILIPMNSQRKFVLTDLESDQLYHIFIVANSNFGNSEPSEIATVRTTITDIGKHEIKENYEKPSKNNKQDDEVTKLLYIVIPVCSAVVVIVIVIAVACLYVYSRRLPPSVPAPYMPCSKDVFVYTPSMSHRSGQSMLTSQHSESSFKFSPYSTMPLTAFDKEEEPIYESVIDEMRNTMKRKEKELEFKTQRV